MPLDPTPNTLAYMIAGYVVLLGTPILYVLSWALRHRGLERDVELIQSLSEEKKQ